MLNVKQIPPHVGYYLAGFADGEGSFNVSIRKREDYKSGWKVSVCFNVSQKEQVILSLFKRWLKCGTIRKREDGVTYYEVNNLKAIQENVIPFFNRFKFMSQKKKRDFAKFKQIVEIIDKGEHLTYEGIKKILEVRELMNDGGKRKHSTEEILSTFIIPSETVRQTPQNGEKIQSVPCSDAGKQIEMSARPDKKGQ